MLITDILQSGLKREASVYSAVPKRKWLYPERGLKVLSSFSMVYSKVFSNVYLKISKCNFAFVVPFFYDRQWKYLRHFVSMKKASCHNAPPPQKEIGKDVPFKACGFSVAMFGKILIANQCFIECIIFFLPIMTYRNSFPNSVRRLTAL